MKKTCKLLLLFAIAILPLQSFDWIGMPTPTLHVDGRYLLDPTGSRVLLHGLHMTPHPWFNGCSFNSCQWDKHDATGCLDYFRAFLNKVTDTTEGWYCNLLRLHIDKYWTDKPWDVYPPFKENDYTHFNYDNFKNTVDNVIVPIINHARSRGMYVILRPPGVCPDSFDINDGYFNLLITVWDYLSEHSAIKNADNVMFELFNEPVKLLANGVWSTIGDQAHFDKLKDICQAMVDTIRANGSNNIIWIPGIGWQSELQGFKNNPVTGENIGYAAHVYPGYWGQDNNNPTTLRANWNKFIKPCADFAPIAITETNWAPAQYGAWGVGITGTVGQTGFGANLKANIDDAGNISWNVLGPDDLLDKADPNGNIAYNNDPQACANAVYNWFKEYSNSYVPHMSFDNISTIPLFEIYPNPSVSGNFTVSISDPAAENTRLYIYNLEGKKVFEQSNLITGDNYVCSGRRNGIYVVKVSSNRRSFMNRMVITK